MTFNLGPIVYLIQGRLNRNKTREHLHINNDHVGAAAFPCVTETTEAPVNLDRAWGSKPQLSAPGLIQQGEAGVDHVPLLTGSDGRCWGGPWHEGAECVLTPRVTGCTTRSVGILGLTGQYHQHID